MDSLEFSVSKAEKIFAGIISAAITLFVMLAVLTGLYISVYDSNALLLIVPVVALSSWCFLSRFLYLPQKITGKHIVALFIFWKVLLPIESTTRLRITSYYDKVTPWAKIQEYESILLKSNAVLLRYVYFSRRPKAEGMGDFLVKRVRAVAPKAVVSIF
ncbi:MAG: hypothetical protein AB7D51_09325 [Desulfovibrionaceae bacterium]